MRHLSNISSTPLPLPCVTSAYPQSETLRLGQIEKCERLWLTGVFFKHTDLGETGQDLAMIAFANAGYIADFPQDKKSGDIRLTDWLTGEILSVEVKTARRGKGDIWTFCLKRRHTSGRLKTDVQDSDYALLLAIDGGEIIPFVIPSAICNATKIEISSSPATYAGKWAIYRRAAL